MSSKLLDGILVIFFLVLAFVFMAVRPEALYQLGYLNKDEGMLLSVTDRLLAGKKLYQDAFFPYGPLSIQYYTAWSRLLGNSPSTFLICVAPVYAFGFWIGLKLLRKYCTRPGLLILGIVTFGSIVWRLWVSSRIYVPFELTAILLIALGWKAPPTRTRLDYIFSGLLLGVLQWIKFGSGVIAGTALILAEIGWIFFAAPRTNLIRHWTSWWPLFAAAAAVELLRVGWFFSTLPLPIFKDTVFPAFMIKHYQHYGAGDTRHVWAGWSLFLNYQLPILAAAFVVLLGLIKLLKERGRADRPDSFAGIGPSFFLVAFFMSGAFFYFKHKWLVYQYGWLLIIPLVIFLGWYGKRLFIFSAAGLLMVTLSVPYKFVARQKKLEKVVFPTGTALFLEPEEKKAWDGFYESLKTLPNQGRRVVCIHHGSGVPYFAKLENPTRHSWYLPEWVRPYEQDSVAQQMLSADGIVFRNLEEAQIRYIAPTAWHETRWSHFLSDENREKIKDQFVVHANIQDKWIILAPKQAETN